MMGMKIQRLIGSNCKPKMTGYLSPRYRRALLAVVALFGLWLIPTLAGADTLISQGYISSGDIPVGSIVSLQQNSSDIVEATTTTSSNILGVVIDSGGSQVSVSSGQTNQVQVATNGVEQVFIADINGAVSQGDSITASPIGGVGMKATGNAKVVGIAQGSFPNATASQQTYTDQAGKKHSVKLGQVSVLVNVAYYYKQPDKTLIPPALQNIANALAGKTVNSLPILISIGIFIVTMLVVVSIIYALIHSSIISVGRNPMSQSAVYRNVIQISALVVVILAVAIGAIYMVLTKF
jgi:hypothetical protein